MNTPKLDNRTLEEVIAQTAALATAYTADGAHGPWRASGQGETDLGAALIRVFGGMIDHLIRQLNEVPDKHRLAFTQLIGAARIPPRAARAAVTFQLAPGAGISVVPAGAQVAAGDIVFETELALPLTRVQLQAAFVRDAPAVGRYADRTRIALGDVPGTFDALSAIAPPRDDDSDNRALEHELWLALDRLLGLPGVETLTVSASGPTAKIGWSAWDGARWVSLLAAASAPWTFSMLSNVQATNLQGQRARWLRGTLESGQPNAPVTLSARVAPLDASRGPAPDAAYCNSVLLDLTRDQKPLGERPQPGDVFYIASDAAFGTDGVQITLTFTLTTPGAPADGLTLAWESWDGVRATALTVTDTTNAFRSSGSVIFSLAKRVPRSTINGLTQRWIRVRITAGNYGHPVSIDFTQTPPRPIAATLQPPVLGALAIACTASSAQADLQIVRRTALSYESLPANQVVPYRAAPDDDVTPALYLGFDRAFEAGLTTLYFEVIPPPAPEPRNYGSAPPPFQPPELIWEYWSSTAAGWSVLTVDDETRNLAHSGLVRFNAAPDALPLERFGKTLYWLRVRSRTASFAPSPQLGRVLLNTVWAAHCHTTELEMLGSSNGARGQTFRLAQAPVLEGQQIEVCEPEAPRDSELARLRADEAGELVSKAPTGYWVRWHAVPDFWASGPRDRHYTFNAETGTVSFGDGVSGMIPPLATANVRAARYRSGGGVSGNVAADALQQLKTSIPFVQSVTNHSAAVGGAAIEPTADGMNRAARTLRHGYRAVTAQDFADLALEASGAVARAVTLTPSFSPIDWDDLAQPHSLNRDAQVIVVIVPVAAQPGHSPSIDLLAQITDYLRQRCTPDVKLQVIGPSWVATDIALQLASTRVDNSAATLEQVRSAIAQFLDPVTGGEAGRGWDFGRRPRTSDLLACVAKLPGVDHVARVDIQCPPFDNDDFGGLTPSIDALSLYPRLLFYARQITVTAARPEAS